MHLIKKKSVKQDDDIVKAKKNTLRFNEQNQNLMSNRSQRLKGKLRWVPIRTVENYFFWNYENLYFLALAVFQLMTIAILPKEWSPTGPYSTAIPLALCILLEIVTDLYRWVRNYRLDTKDNYRIVECYPNMMKQNADLRPGDVIKLCKEEVVPADGILLDCGIDKYGKLSLAPLNGESQIHVVEKPSTKLTLKDYEKAQLIINNYHQNSYHNLDATLKIGEREQKIDGSCFVVSNSIVKSNEITIWVTRCGEEKKSYVKSKSVVLRQNRMDRHIADYMMNINSYLLVGLIFLVSLIKLVYSNYHNFIHGFLFFGVQNWILFNGVIPFSVKIFLILIRNYQASRLSKNTHIIVNTPILMDDVDKVDLVVSDKTGTLTKNELEFTKLVQVGYNEIISVNGQVSKPVETNLLRCLGLCIHQTDGDYSTVEDKTIRYRYHYLDSQVVQKGEQVVLTLGKQEYQYRYVEISGLDFSYARRMSSKVVRDEEMRYYIYSKGSLDVVRSKLVAEDKEELDRLDKLISNDNPELRLLACTYREVRPEELLDGIGDSRHRDLYVQRLEKDLHLLGIIGIRDNLQEKVKETVISLRSVGLECAICTGDRKITALAIAKEAGIVDDENNVVDYEMDMIDPPDGRGKVLLFSGATLAQIRTDPNRYADFQFDLKGCKSFVGYNLRPDDKRRLTKILERSNRKILNIGDGFNDISMFETGSVSVAIKGNHFVESNADFVIDSFHQLGQLIREVGPDYYYRNSLLANFTFYRCLMVVTCLVSWCLLQYDQLTTTIFNGFVMQAFHIFWCSVPIVYFCLNDKTQERSYKRSRKQYDSNLWRTSLWNFSGLLSGLWLTVWSYGQYMNQPEVFGDRLAFLVIIAINLKLTPYGFWSLDHLITLLVGPCLFLLYSIYSGSLFAIVTMFLLPSGWVFLAKLFFGLIVINLITY